MKKQLTLKLIESNDTPNNNDLVWNQPQGYHLYKESNHSQGYNSFELKLIKPIAISDDEIKNNDSFYDSNNKLVYYFRRNSTEEGYIICDNELLHIKSHCKKIEILPEQFPTHILQAIVEGKLKDSDTVEVEYSNCLLSDDSGEYIVLDSNNKVIITYSTFKVVSKEELESRGSLAYEYFNPDYPMEDITPIYNKPITYSEEEVYFYLESLVKNIAIDEDLLYHYDGDYRDLKDWFNQIKKK